MPAFLLKDENCSLERLTSSLKYDILHQERI